MWNKISVCRVCKEKTDFVLSCGNIPFVTSNNEVVAQGKSFAGGSARLTLQKCSNCCHLQLGEFVEPHLLYDSFSYESEFTQGLLHHFEAIVAFIMKRLQKEKPIIMEVGSNSGAFLLCCQKKGANVIGIEPSRRLANRANTEGLPTIHGYFSSETSSQAIKAVGSADCLYIANTLANIDDLHDFFSTADGCLQHDGILLVDTQDGEKVLDNLLIDTVYHEHLNYFTEYSLSKIANQYGFFLEQTIKHSSKGGAMLCVFSKLESRSTSVYAPSEFDERISNFRLGLDEMKTRVSEHLQKYSRSLAFGSSVGCSMLMSFLSLGDRVMAVLDDNPQIDVILTEHGPVSVVATAEVAKYNAESIILLAHRYEQSIRQSLNKSGISPATVIFNPWIR